MGYGIMRNLKEIADSLETSIEIIEAIDMLDNGSKTEKEIIRIWNDPSYETVQKVLETAFSKTNEDELHWGLETIRREANMQK